MRRTYHSSCNKYIWHHFCKLTLQYISPEWLKVWINVYCLIFKWGFFKILLFSKNGFLIWRRFFEICRGLLKTMWKLRWGVNIGLNVLWTARCSQLYLFRSIYNIIGKPDISHWRNNIFHMIVTCRFYHLYANVLIIVYNMSNNIYMNHKPKHYFDVMSKL